MTRAVLRKPPVLYIVALWILFQQQYYLLYPLRSLAPLFGGSPASVRTVEMYGAIPIVVLLFALLRLHNVARWISAALLAVATAVLLRLLIGALLQDMYVTPRFFVIVPLMVAANALCIQWLMWGGMDTAIRQTAAQTAGW